uniref:HEPN domain-containing protein n=1 Tax=Neogobius melanostomus TaxID=47308 RepID=A0A8C6S680_9GOBI
MLEKLSKCHLGEDIYEHHKLLKLLPQRLQPQMLSQITEEKVVETQMELCERNCDFSGFFRKHLSSTVFRYGLINLIRAQSLGEIKHQEATEMCKTTFGRIKIICCESLQTELWMEKQRLPNTAEKKDAYVTHEQQDCIFYLKHYDALTSKVENKTCITIAKKLILFHCDTQEDVQTILKENQICDGVANENYKFDLQAPGTEIPEEWHDALDMNTLNNFEEGEYVGYYSNGKYIYAVIVEELPGHSGQLTRRYKINTGEEEPIEVSFLDLYQFKRETHSTASTGLELQKEGATPHSSEQTTRSFPVSVEEANKESDTCLNDIWTLPKGEPQKAIRRLYLRWHSVKNSDDPLIATEAFKYLRCRLDKLPNGNRKAIDSRSFSSFSGENAHFSDYFPEWDEEARHHRASRERFHTGHRSYNFWTFNDNIPQPNKGEAKRWCRQAQSDLNAVSNDIGKGSTEWCLFKVHQAVEKSLIAASYQNNGKQPTALSGLSQLVRDLIALDVDAKKTQYPTYHSFPKIPNGQFRSANERQALDKKIMWAHAVTSIEKLVSNKYMCK